MYIPNKLFQCLFLKYICIKIKFYVYVFLKSRIYVLKINLFNLTIYNYMLKLGVMNIWKNFIFPLGGGEVG